MSILREQLINGHIESHYPNAKMVHDTDPDCDLVFYSKKQLAEVDGDWFPLSCRKDPESGETLYGGRKRIVHTYTEGETGAGKTTRFVMQSILALSSMKTKPSFVIVDIHGEIIENLYGHLKSNGYDVKILNCDDPKRSDTYNPFYELATDCRRNGAIDTETMNQIRRISEIIQPVESLNDPVWDKGARAYTQGCILDKFEDLINGDIPIECLTVYNIIQNHYWLRDHFGGEYVCNLLSIPHYENKGSTSLSVQKMLAVTNNAEKTRASYFGVVENHYDTFGQPAFYSLSSSNTISISDFIEKPTAIVIQSGCTRIGDDLISLLVNDIYTKVVKVGKAAKDKRLPRNIHCFLDEFANCNIANGPEYIKMLTTSRKFGMFWHMILQCDAQLDTKFDSHIARIIRANSTEIFMGSQDYETEVRFAKSCGQKTIESLASVISQHTPHLETVDLITAESLNLTEEGYAYVKSNRHPLLKTYIEAFYRCDDFLSEKYTGNIYPYNGFDYTATRFTPDDIGEYKASQATPGVKEDPSVFFGNRSEAAKEIPYGECEDDEASQKSLLSRLRTLIDDDFDTKKDNGEIDEEDWEDYDFNVTNDPVYVEMENKLSQITRKKLDKVISQATMIPKALEDLVYEIHTKGKSGDYEENEIPHNFNVLKFEIIEAFIINNDFPTKGLWSKAAQKEYEFLKKSDIFPPDILNAFAEAANEIKNELTLSNIKEIKRIVSDATT